jgi:hypothetical protein
MTQEQEFNLSDFLGNAKHRNFAGVRITYGPDADLAREKRLFIGVSENR